MIVSDGRKEDVYANALENGTRGNFNDDIRNIGHRQSEGELVVGYLEVGLKSSNSRIANIYPVNI